MKYQCAKCETIFEHEKYLTECDGEKTCPICDTMEVVYRLSNPLDLQVDLLVMPKIAEVYIMKIDEYYHLTEDISLPCEITFGGSLKIYVEENGKISQAVNGWGNKADEFIGREIEIFQKIKSNFSE